MTCDSVRAADGGPERHAIAAATRHSRHSKAMSVRFLAARILMEAGAVGEGAALDQRIGVGNRPVRQPQAHGKILEGLMALNSGTTAGCHQDSDRRQHAARHVVRAFRSRPRVLRSKVVLQADSEFDLCITRRGEAISLMGEGPTYGYFPPVYYYQGRVRQELNTAAFADSYREYLKIRGASTEDPLARDVRKRIGN